LIADRQNIELYCLSRNNSNNNNNKETIKRRFEE